MATKLRGLQREGSERKGSGRRREGRAARSQWRPGGREEPEKLGPTTADVQLLAHQRCWNAAMLINPGGTNPRGFSPQKPG